MIIPQHEGKYRVVRYDVLGERRGLKYWFRKGVAFLFSQVGVGGLLLGYTILGALVFISLEGKGVESRRSVQVSRLRAEVVAKLWNVTHSYNLIQTEKWEKDVKGLLSTFQLRLVQEIRMGFDGSSDPIWTFPAALIYSLSVYTTIGYGSPLTPKTKLGKAMTIFYALFGIPLLLLYMANVGNLLANLFRQFYTWVERCRQNLERSRRIRLQVGEGRRLSKQGRSRELGVITEEEDDNNDHNPVRVKNAANEVVVPIPISSCLAVFVCYVILGSILFSWWEGWDYLDGSYFCFLSLVTIGFGDLVPGSSAEDRRRGSVDSELVLCSIYLLVGLALMAMCFQLTQERFFQRARRLGKRLGLI